MVGVKVIRSDRPVFVNRRMHDTQRRAWRKIQASEYGTPDLVDAKDVADILKISRSALQAMIANGEFPAGGYRLGSRNAWTTAFVQLWLALGESHG